MTTRTARCACGRVEVTVEGEPGQVYVCHCDFCQRRSGNVFIASASFPEDQVISITGETRCYNGLQVDGVGAVGIPEGINYRFCAVCGSSIWANGIGTKFPPCIDTMAALPPENRNLAAQYPRSRVYSMSNGMGSAQRNS